MHECRDKVKQKYFKIQKNKVGHPLTPSYASLIFRTMVGAPQKPEKTNTTNIPTSFHNLALYQMTESAKIDTLLTYYWVAVAGLLLLWGTCMAPCVVRN